MLNQQLTYNHPGKEMRLKVAFSTKITGTIIKEGAFFLTKVLSMTCLYWYRN
jgi:hypothetical protein